MCFRPSSAGISRTCPQCKATCGPTDAACPQCGAELSSKPPAPGAPKAPGAAPSAPKAPGASGVPGK